MKNTTTIDIRKAAAIEIASLRQPVITLYQIAIIIFKLYQTGTYKGEKLANIRKAHATRSDCTRIVRSLTERGVLEESRSARHAEVFTVLGREQGTPAEIACSVDPFAYISHMSAMEWHGLTDRIGHTLFYSSPPPIKWREFAWEKMQKDVEINHVQEYLTQSLPRLKRINLKRIGRSTIHRYLSEHLGAFISINDRCLRVSTIGRTFLDMIREPDLCGGIYHVIDVYEQHAPKYLKLIVDDIDRHGTKIDKVRAGYIIEERIGLDEPRLQNWSEFAQRGGSRKLYAGDSYSPEYSEKWCLSLNI